MDEIKIGKKMLTAEQVQFYNSDGYLLIPNVFNKEEISECVQETAAMFQRLQMNGGKLEATWGGKWQESQIEQTERGQTSVLSIHNMQYHSAVFTRMLVHRQLTSAVVSLIGPNVQLHHTKLQVKPPYKGSPFPLHQDYEYFPHANDTMLAAVVYLEDSSVENGCLCVVPGVHRQGAIDHQHDGSHYLAPEKYPLDQATPCEGKAGDVLIFSYLTPHGSNPNRTKSPRRIVLFQFRSADDLPLKEVHKSPGQGMMIAGINPIPTAKQI